MVGEAPGLVEAELLELRVFMRLTGPCGEVSLNRTGGIHVTWALWYD